MPELQKIHPPIQLSNLSEISGRGSVTDCTDQSKLLCSLKKPSYIHISCRDIRYSVNVWTKTNQDNGIPFKRERKEVLKGISGDFQSYELTGIIGISGSGKSSLLDILSGYSQNYTGSVLYNGEVRSLRWLRKHVAYIMQDCSLHDLLTVQEAMLASAQLKLDRHITSKQRWAKVMDILEILGLKHKADSYTGTLSGGEKKRMAFALELVSNPPVMFFDEPTTGLDYHIANKFLRYLSEMAKAGYNIICSLHQPSASTLDLLDHMYVIGDGRCIYQGSTQQLTTFLAELNMPCPKYHNPADHVLDLTTNDSISNVDQMVSKTDNGKNKDWRRTALQYQSITNVERSSTSDLGLDSAWTRFTSEVSILILRTLTLIHRDNFMTYVRLAIHCGIGFLIGSVYWGVGCDAAYIMDNFRVLFYTVMFLMFTSFSSMIVTYPLEMPVVTREHFNRWYSLKSYYFAVSFAHVPMQILCTLAYCVIVYLMSMQPLELSRFGLFLLMCIAVTLLTQAIGLLVGAVFNVEHGVIFGPLAVLPWLIFSGFFLSLNDSPYILHWLFHISFLKYALDGLVIAVYGYGREKLMCSDDYCHFRLPAKFLKQMGMADASYWVSLSFIVSLLLVIKVLTYYVIRYRLKNKR